MPWYALQTRSNTEELVEAAIQRERIEAFYPFYEKTDLRRRVFRRPFFPGYVFVNIELEERGHLLHIPQIVRFVGQGPKPAVIPDQEVINVRLVTEYAVKIAIAPAEYYSPGQEVRVTKGPLAGAVGMVMHVKNATRLVVFVTMFNQSVSTEIDARDVEVVHQKAA